MVNNLEQSCIPGQQLFLAFSAVVGTPFWYCIIIASLKWRLAAYNVLYLELKAQREEICMTS